MKPILAPHDGRRQFGSSRIRTYDHLHASPELYHCATGTYLIKADTLEFAAHVNPGWADAENVLFLEAALSIHRADRHGCREGGGNHDGHNVQCPQDHFAHLGLWQENDKRCLMSRLPFH